MQPEFPSREARDVFRALKRCGVYFTMESPDADAAWEIVEPLISCDHFTGGSASPKYQQQLRSFVMAMAGDCCYHSNQPEEAVGYYQEAIHLGSGSIVAPMLARTVIEYGLEHHYHLAADAAADAERAWKQRSILFRGMAYAYWYLVVVMRDRRMQQWYKEGKEFCREVQRRASSMPDLPAPPTSP